MRLRAAAVLLVTFLGLIACAGLSSVALVHWNLWLLLAANAGTIGVLVACRAAMKAWR
jgi:hypothetical protein